MFAAEGLAQLHLAADLHAEAHAARAVDAARHFLGAHQRPQVLGQHHALFFLVARGAGAVADRHVLQHAFAALVADRAIQGVVDQEEFHHAVLRLHGLGGIGQHFHAFGDRRGAGGQRLGRFFHLHQTHAAVGGDGELLVVAEMRDGNARLVRRLDDGVAAFSRHLFAVYFDIDHIRPTPDNVCVRCDARTHCDNV